MNVSRKIELKIEHAFLCVMQRVKYSYFAKHYPKYLQKMGVRFSGDIEKTGFVAPSISFDSKEYAKYITLGERTTISGGVLLLVHDYSIGAAMRGAGVDGVRDGHLPHLIKEIKIGNDCFIGIRSIILPGTTIGDRTIVGAGAVVKGNIPAGVIVAGNPAKIIGTVEEYVAKHVEMKDYCVK